MTVTEVTETEIFHRRDSTDWRQMPMARIDHDRVHMHSRQLYPTTFIYCGKFSWSVNFVTVRAVTKKIISPRENYPQRGSKPVEAGKAQGGTHLLTFDLAAFVVIFVFFGALSIINHAHLPPTSSSV